MARTTPAILMATAAVLALGACSPNGGYDATKPQAAAANSSALALPPIDPPPAAYSEDRALAYDGYALAERAHAFDTSVRDRRPDYAFRYEDERPLAWRTADDYSMYAEPYGDGYRNYYYAPGADHPYFVRDREYGYGYGPDGRLAAVYDRRGALLPSDRFAQVASVAAAIYLRAHTVRRYGNDDRYRVALSDRSWSDRSRSYAAWQEPWIAAPEREPQWREWRRTHAREVVTYAPAAPLPRLDNEHRDNGRHLGWAKQDEKRAEKQDRKAEKAERRDEDRFARAYAPAVVGVPAAAVEVRQHGNGNGKDKHGEGPGHGKGHDKPGKGEGPGHGKGHKD